MTIPILFVWDLETQFVSKEVLKLAVLRAETQCGLQLAFTEMLAFAKVEAGLNDN